jgi:hypothetical protein
MKHHKVIILFAIFVAAIVGCTRKIRLKHHSIKVEVVKVMWPKILVRITNRTERPIVLWDISSYLGWYNFSLKLESPVNTKEPTFILPAATTLPPEHVWRKEAAWPSDIALVNKVEPGKYRESWLNLGDGLWTIPNECVSNCRNGRVTVYYAVTESPESHKHDVLTGIWKSSAVRFSK